MCPHHFLPVTYDVAIGYVPTEGGLGLSKLARLVQTLARAPKLQEDFTKEIISILTDKIKPLVCMVIVKGEHLCMQMRGVKKPGCVTTTSEVFGVFEKPEVRSEFMELIKNA
jgi:GTP cyclohydrolase I